MIVRVALAAAVAAWVHSDLDRAQAQDPQFKPSCLAEKDVPRVEEVVAAWCAEAMKGDRGGAYFAAGWKLSSLQRRADAFRMVERAAELGDTDGLLHVGWWTFQGIGTTRDLPRGIALLETAVKRAGIGAVWLVEIYEGEVYPYARHLRDPMKATMWKYIPLVANDESDLSSAWVYGQRMGLTDDDVREAHRRAVHWVAENMPAKRR